MAKDFESGNGLKLGLFMQQNQLQRPAENAFTYANEAGQQKSGAEVVESLMALWQEKDFVSVDSPLADMDIPSLRLLKKVKDFYDDMFAKIFLHSIVTVSENE